MKAIKIIITRSRKGRSVSAESHRRAASAGRPRRSPLHRDVRPSLPFSRVIALSLRPSAARSSSSCKVKVTSDVLCYNRWGAEPQVQCLVESGRDTRLAIDSTRISRTVPPVIYEQWKVHELGVEFCLNYHVKLTPEKSHIGSLNILIGKNLSNN